MSLQRVLIVRTSAMGDIVHALPVLERVRRLLPRAQIGWVVEAAFAPLLEGHPSLDAVLPVGLRTWRRRPWSRVSWREAIEFLGRLQNFSADIVLDLMGTHKAGLIGACTLADHRLGLRRADRREPSSAIWMSATTPATGRHSVDRMLSVLSAGDLVPNNREPTSFGPDLLPSRPWRRGPDATGQFALLHPCTSWSNKNYPVESWSTVVRSLRREAGLETWIAWGPGEEARARRLAELAEAKILETLTTLPELVALSRAARLVLGGDTGPVHLAHALGTPVVCVMGPTDPDRNGPYGMPEAAVAHRLPCSFCYRRLDEPKACLLNIAPEQVVEKAIAILG